MKKSLIIFFFLISTVVIAQNNLSFSFENKTLEEMITQIEQQTNFKFYFIKDWLPQDKFTKSYNNQPIDVILQDLLSSTVLNYYIMDDFKVILTENVAIHDQIPEGNVAIVIQEKEDEFPEDTTKEEVTETNQPVQTEETKPEVVEPEEVVKIGKQETTPQEQAYTISGYVRDAQTGNPLANVAVSVRGKGIGTSTDANGYYELKLPSGNYVLLTNSLSAKDARKRIVVYNDGEVNFNLEEEIETLQEVLIEADVDRNVKEIITGVTSIEVEEIKNIPLVLGERDILKVATTLPGISNTGEGSNGYNVRGGKTDQNLVLLDNAAIYNPSHFFGIFSAINPFTTGNVKIYKGNIPAEYGGRLSSVFNIESKDANTQELAGEASIGPVTGNLALEIPVVNEKAGLMVGGRSTYSGWILRSIDEESIRDSEASFFDVIAKYNHQLNENNSVRATAYYSKDRFSITSDSLYGYSNRLLSAAWQHNFNDKHRGSLAISNSEYQFEIEYDGDFSNDFDLNYKNNETELKLKLDYQLDENKTITYGIASKLYEISPGSIEPLNSESQVERLDIEKERGLESAVFVSANVEVNEQLGIDTGLRFSTFSFLGAATQRIYEEGEPRNEATLVDTRTFGKNEFIKTFSGLEARVSARYFILEDLSVKASYNNTYQYIHTLSTNTTVSPTDTWKLSDLNIEPQRAQQFALGVYKNFSDNLYEVSLEGYYKTYNNILDYKVGAQLLLNETLETEVLQGEGRSYGVEFLIRKNAGQNGRWNGWIGYTYSRTELKLDSEHPEERVNNGNYFPANYDKPHDFSAVLNYKLTKRFSFSGNFVYQTGRPITYPVGTYEFGGAEYTLYSDRNKFRIPDFYRLDVGFNYEGNHKIKKLAHSFWNLSIYNVLGRNNPYSVFFVTEEGEIKAYQSSIFAIPIPTLTFNFKF